MYTALHVLPCTLPPRHAGPRRGGARRAGRAGRGRGMPALPAPARCPRNGAAPFRLTCPGSLRPSPACGHSAALNSKAPGLLATSPLAPPGRPHRPGRAHRPERPYRPGRPRRRPRPRTPVSRTPATGAPRRPARSATPGSRRARRASRREEDRRCLAASVSRRVGEYHDAECSHERSHDRRAEVRG